MRINRLTQVGIFLLLHVLANALPIPDGYWRGAVNRGGSIQLIEVTVAENKSTYSLPDLGLFEEALVFTSITDSAFKIKTFMGEFTCYYNDTHKEITGDNKSWKPVPLQIHLKKILAPPAYYRIKEITVPAAQVLLKGQLFQPIGVKKAPLLIIAHGADNPTITNWVYRHYAYTLTQYGYAVFIFDQRGSGASGGQKEPSLMQNADDLISIGKYFSASKDIDSKRMAIIGESRGGWIAPIASAKSKLFKTQILLAGPAQGPIDLEFNVVKFSLEDQGFTKKQVDSAINYTKIYFEAVRGKQDWSKALEMWQQIKERPWASILQASTEPTSDFNWWKENDINPEEYLRKVNASTLAVFGSADVLVPAAANKNSMETYLSASGKPMKISIIPNLPHGIYHYSTLVGNQFAWPVNFWIWPKRSTMMDEIILDWLKVNL